MFLQAKHFFVMALGDSDETWNEHLKANVNEHAATCAFITVSGDTTGHLKEFMPKNITQKFVWTNLASMIYSVEKCAGGYCQISWKQYDWEKDDNQIQ